MIGVDLAGLSDPIPPSAAVQLVIAPAVTWEPKRAFDLITRVHGLHYVGDKLAVLTRAASWLAPGGLLAADLDLRSIRLPGRRAGAGRPAAPGRGAHWRVVSGPVSAACSR